MGIKLLTRLRVRFSHIKEHKFRHNFQDAINPLCCCGNLAESTTHFFLHCTHFSNQKLALINKIKDIFEKNDSLITQTSSFWGTPAKKLQNLRPAASKVIILRLQHHQDSRIAIYERRNIVVNSHHEKLEKSH